MGRVNNAESFFELLQLAIDYAPDFPDEDGQPADEQLDLDKAFQQLEHGLSYFQDRLPAAKLQQCSELLAQAQEEFRQGKEFHGANTLGQLNRRLKKR